MRKRCIQNVVIHVPKQLNINNLTEQINDFYIEVVERKLKNSGLPKEKQIDIIDRIMEKIDRGVF